MLIADYSGDFIQGDLLLKKITITSLIMIIALISVMTAACAKKPEEPVPDPTLESFMAEHPDVLKEIEASASGGEKSGVRIDVSGNDLIYTYDIANVEDVDEDFAKSDATKESLTKSLDAQGDNFRSVASSIETILQEAGVEIEGVRVVVNYTYGDEVIVSGTFEPGQAAEKSPAEEEDKEEDSDTEGSESTVNNE